MKFLAKQFRGDGELVCIGLTPLELLAVNNALNEICNGVHISDAAFETRLGVSRVEARSLLNQINALLA